MLQAIIRSGYVQYQRHIYFIEPCWGNLVCYRCSFQKLSITLKDINKIRKGNNNDATLMFD